MKSFKYIQFIMALAVLLLAALAGCGNTDPDGEITEEPTSTATQALEPLDGGKVGPCLDFEDLIVGTSYVVGDSIPTGGILLHVKEFTWGNGTQTAAGEAHVDNGGTAGGSGSELAVNNVNLVFEFGSPIQDFDLRFGEYGGNLNIEINGDFRNFENFKDIDGMVIGGVAVSVPVGGLGNDQGVLKLSGVIDYLTLGGQELWIDNRCQQGDCLDFEDLVLGMQYTPGDIFMTAGVKVYVRQFELDNGNLAPSGHTEVQNGGMAGGSGNELAVNNVNLAFEFGSTIHDFELLFGEYGGNLNIEINGDFLNFEDFKAIDGMNLGGVDISVPVGGLGNDMGVLKLTGPIDVLMVGGQELWIDHECRPAPGACIDFENLTAGTTYNGGDLFPSSGAIIEVWDFTWSNGTVTADGYALVDNSGMAGGSGNEVNANNVNLYFDFGGLLKGLTLRYGDHGGNLNLEINGDFVNFGTFADINGSVIGGVNVTSTPSGTGGLGTLNLVGEIELFALGGQELWIDDVCPAFKGEPVTFRCADFGHFPDDTQMPQVSSIAGLTITALGPDSPFINDIAAGVHGLQFDSAGLQIDLLAAAHTVTMTVGSYTPEPLNIIALDASGNQVDQVTLPGDNSMHTITLSGQGITRIVITGGGDEGILVDLCFYPG